MKNDDFIYAVSGIIWAIIVIAIFISFSFFAGGCAQYPPVPIDYSVEQCSARSCLGPYGYCNRAEKTIKICPPIPWTKIDDDAILCHEIGHAMEIDGCSRVFCLMYEGKRWEEILAKPIQALYGFRFCGKCKEKVWLINTQK